ncbi:unnamed protein product [Lactuca saligna]|uniref:Arabidopsis retrotransposon Orf1 C-terminal domain-containing protein n=1 Tax=Lactuca saligna TaxID=75948 RepID=A0AA35YKB6_LACSI|nr:unnamed protein product [Lactuca saligna]
MDQLSLDHHLRQLFFHIGWHQFLDLSARTYKQPTIEFLSTYARNDTARVLTFKLQGRQHRLKYKKLNKIMGTYDIYNSDIYSHQWTQFKSLPNVEFWTQITSLPKFNPSRQKDPFIMHPCWRIAHRILSTSIFARHEPGQINTVELYFLYCMSRHRWSLTDFTTFFLDKCDSLRTKTTGDICIGGLITLIGLGMGLQFPASEYVPVDDPPLYLLDCITLMRMELILPHPNLLGHFSWLNHVKDPVYILPNPSLSTFTTNDHETWFLPQDLPDDDDAAADDDMRGWILTMLIAHSRLKTIMIFQSASYLHLIQLKIPGHTFSPRENTPSHNMTTTHTSNPMSPTLHTNFLLIFTASLLPCAFKAIETPQPSIA